MNFSSPLFLLGLALVALPIVIHLWKRQVSRKIVFPSLVLLLRTQKKVSRRIKLKNFLLLLIRSLLILLVPLALAQPYCSSPTQSGLSQAVVLVLDDSFRMKYGSPSLFDNAKERAAEVISSLNQRDAVAIIVASANVAEPPTLFEDHNKAQNTLDETQASFRSTSLQKSLLMSQEVLLAATQPRQRVIVFTDGTQSAWDDAAQSVAWPAGGPQLEIIDVAPPSLPNRAVLDVKVSAAPEIGPKSFKIDVFVGNFSAAPVAELSVQILVAEKVVASGVISMAAAEEKTKSFFVTPTGEGVLPGAVSIASDELGVDDSYPFLLVASREVKALLVNGDPKTVRYEDEAFFIEEALDATSADASRVVYQTITTEGILSQDLSRIDVIALLNVGELGEAELRKIESFVKGGGGLVVSGGDEVKRSLRGLDLLLPVKIRDVFVASDGAFSGDQTPRRLAPVTQKHPLFQDFDPTAPGGISLARFGTILLFESSPFTQGKNVILSFDDGTPALIEGRVGQGKVLIFASTLDRSWSDLPVRPGFVPLVQSLFRYASDESNGGNSLPSIVGEPRPISLVVAKGERLLLTSPSTEERELVVSTGEQNTKLSDLLTPGIWSLSWLDNAGKEREKFSFPVVLSPQGSRLQKVDPSRLQKIAEESGDGIVLEASPEKRSGIPFAHYVLFLVMALVLGESFLIRRG